MDDWVQTVSGRAVSLSEPMSKDIDLEDIAHALSLQCRYNGHTSVFYSVAQHSVLVVGCVNELAKCADAQLLRTALLHDAAEAYIGDMVRPLKVDDDFFRSVEARFEQQIARRFDLIWPHPEIVEHADNAVLLAERDAFMAPPPRPWSVDGQPWPSDGIAPWSPDTARAKFLELAKEWL